MELSATAIIGIINLVLIVLVALHNHLNHVKLTGNDLVHLSADIQEIKSKQEKIESSVNDLSKDLAFVKGNCELHTRKVNKRAKKILNKD